MTAPSAKFYWLGQALGWGLFLVVNVLFAWSYQRNQATAFSLVYVWSALTGIAVTHFWRNWIRNHGLMESARPSNLSQLAGGVVAVGLAQCGSTSLAYAVVRPPGTSFEDLRWLPGALLVWICMAGIWTALYCLGYAIRRARKAELGRLTADIVAKDAALQALKAQINPHFFFNSLNSVRALVFIDQEAAARMIDQIVALMRYALDSQQSDTVPLSEELKIVRTYLMVEKTRFQSRLVIEEQIEAQVETWPVRR